jgi:hypothetical protein
MCALSQNHKLHCAIRKCAPVQLSRTSTQESPLDTWPLTILIYTTTRPLQNQVRHRSPIPSSKTAATEDCRCMMSSDGKQPMKTNPGKVKSLSDKKTIQSALPRTKAMQNEHRSMDQITGYMKLPQGAPQKERDSPPSPKSKKTKTNPSILLSLAEQAIKSTPTARKNSYQSWTAGDNKLPLEAAVNAIFAGEDSTMAAQNIVLSILISCQTLEPVVKKETGR